MPITGSYAYPNGFGCTHWSQRTWKEVWDHRLWLVFAKNTIASNGFETTGRELLIVFTKLRFWNGIWKRSDLHIFEDEKKTLSKMKWFDGAALSVRIRLTSATGPPGLQHALLSTKQKVIMRVFQIYSGKKSIFFYISNEQIGTFIPFNNIPSVSSRPAIKHLCILDSLGKLSTRNRAKQILWVGRKLGGQIIHHLGG